MFIKLKEHIIALDSIQAMYPKTDTVGRGRIEDERAWYIIVDCHNHSYSIAYESREERDRILRLTWIAISNKRN